VGLLGLTIACGEATELLGLSRGDVMNAMTEEMRAPSAARLALSLLAIGLAPALAEETFFRGLLQPRLVAAWGPWGGVAGSAVAFGLIHVDPVHATLAFVAGLFLGFASQRLGGIRPTMAAHAVNNSLFLTLAALRGDELPSTSARAVTLVAGVVMFVTSSATLASRRARVDGGVAGPVGGPTGAVSAKGAPGGA
jgi:membrane protease YdiL (CAAX protease family)